jgi:hypothetical protein
MIQAVLKPRLWLLAWLLVFTTVQAAEHGHGKATNVQSLLPECRDPAALPSVHCGQTPTPVFAKDGSLWLAFAQHGHVYLTRSDDLGESFTTPVVVNRVPEAIYSDGENRPKIALGPAGELYLSWSQRIPGRYAGNIRFARSLDAGQSFSEPITVNDDSAPISHRFDALTVDSQGRIYLVWIDKRDLAAAKKAGTDYAGAAIYYAMSDDRGEHFAFNHKLSDHSCECCRIALDMGSNDQVVALWRHVYPVNIRDHAIARLGPDTPPIQGMPVRATDDDWQIEGCPHHGPGLSLATDHTAHLAWFSQGNRNKGLMYGRFDLNRGQLELEYPIDPSAGASRPQVLATAQRIYTAWKAFNGEANELRVSFSEDAGKSWSEPQVVAQTANGSDHPFLLTQGDRVFLSWHTLAEGYRLIPAQLAETTHVSP